MKIKTQSEINKQFPPLTKTIKVTDDWYPCFSNNIVKIYLRVCIASWDIKYPYYLKFQAWGADDFGLEKEELFTDYSQISDIYNYCKNQYDNIPEIANKEYFYNIGFKVF